MPQITQELLRKRAEHNEGLLSTLEEISLHQQDIEKIENLDQYCRHLKILYLQSNLIGKMEGLHKLKELEYLNLAVNNVSKIEGIRNCESLMKLDMTLNFIDIEDLEDSIDNLTYCPEFNELYLTGNPCESWPGCKEYIIAKIKTIKRFDGDEITKSQRLAALQKIKQLEEELRIAAQENIEKKKKEIEDGKDFSEAYTKESRIEAYKEMQAKKEEDEKKSKENSMFKDFYEMEENAKKKEPIGVYNQFGDIRQCNEAKYEFEFKESEDKTCIIFEIQVPKFLDTSLLKLDLQPLYVRLEIKERVTQLKFPEEIIVEKSKVQRSMTTGVLCVTCPKANISEIQAKQMRHKKQEEEKQKQDKLKSLDQQQQEAKKELERKRQEGKDFTIRERQEQEQIGKKDVFIPDFNIDDVPPLE